MYQTGDTVMHPSEGVCTIVDVRSIRFSGNDFRDYYVLRPSMEKGSGKVYLPVERGNAVLRRLLSRQDILDMIHSSRCHASLWADDNRVRKDRFISILHEGNYAKVIQMIREIHEHEAQRIAEGKKLSVSDEHVRTEAERILHQEFSYVLKMNLEDTVQFILKELNIQ